MYAVVRRYQHASALGKAMHARQAEVEALLSSVPGFVTYYAVLTDDGELATVTVCQDQAGTTESTRRAAEWVRANLPDASLAPPEIVHGETFISIGS
jgi:hypothetical protein